MCVWLAWTMDEDERTKQDGDTISVIVNVVWNSSEDATEHGWSECHVVRCRAPLFL